MNLVIDVGNTTVHIGIFDNGKLLEQSRFHTNSFFTDDECHAILLQKLTNIDTKKIQNVLYSSVVPSVKIPLFNALRRIVDIEPMVISPGMKTGLSISVDNPLEIGNDLIADLVATKTYYGYPSLIIDLGTASKIICLDKNGTFSYCTFMPGLYLSASSLSSKAALLPDFSLEKPKTVLTKNTFTAMNSGIVLGHVDMIMGLIKRYEDELGYTCKKILTGGHSLIIKDLLPEDYIHDVNLNLKGLQLLIEKNTSR